ncbi:nitroreductase family protein [bacterium]|nr:nitroreductase family protein [bacterium]
MNNLNLKVDKSKCIKCGKCIDICTNLNIEFDTDKYPRSINNSCFGCQHCMAVCPTGAISVFDKNPDNCAEIKHSVNSDDFMNLVETRRSCRHYKQENVNNEIMYKLKNMLNWVPTGCNFKDLHFSIVENKDRMQEIREKLYKKLRFLLRFIPVNGRLKTYKNAILSGEDMILRNAPHMIVVSTNKKAPCKNIDPIIALSYFELYAQTLGLGTLWCGLAYKTLPLCKDVMRDLDIPKTHNISYVMLFGYPNVTFKRGIQPNYYNISELK